MRKKLLRILYYNEGTRNWLKGEFFQLSNPFILIKFRREFILSKKKPPELTQTK